MSSSGGWNATGCCAGCSQEDIHELTASVIREDLVRFDSLPLVTRAPSVMGVAPGSKVRLAISGIDLLDINFHAESHGDPDAAA